MITTSEQKLEPALYIVPTPIGNLEDITLRALRILKLVDIIACEDTRTTGKLLKLLNLPPKKLVSYYEHNEKQKAQQVINFIKEQNSVALISEAGMPCISDPGYRLVNLAIEEGIKVIVLPGASASLTALVASGFPTNEFKFLGFPPEKKGRKVFLHKIADSDCTTIVYISPYKLIKFLQELKEYCGDNRKICICRELTKMYEEFIRGTIDECLNEIKKKTSIKGEIVLIIDKKQGE